MGIIQQRDQVSSVRVSDIAGSKLRFLPLAALALYSVSLFVTELMTSQEYVRIYFTDIGQPYKQGFFGAAEGQFGYAINTSLSSFLLGGSGLLLMFSSFAGTRGLDGQGRLFFVQSLILFYMALDDRLMLHERVGAAMGIPSSVVLASAALLNLAAYAFWFRASYFTARMAVLLAIAAALFGSMMFSDVFLPHYLPGRLSFEDLCKVWAGYCFLLFAWNAAIYRLLGKPEDRNGGWVPMWVLRMVPSRLRVRILS